MNGEDLISIGGKKLPIRVVLGIMEIEADLKGASYWASFLLYHAFDFKDTELRGEVERRLSQMGQPKYDGINSDMDGDDNPPSEIRLSQEEINFKIRCAIYELMDIKTDNGKYLFEHQNQWVAIFWCIVELAIGIYEYQYEDFKNLIDQLTITDIRVKFVLTSINDCTHTDYQGIPSAWVCSSTTSRGKNAFNRMKEISEAFQKLLEKHGLKRPQNPS